MKTKILSLIFIAATMTVSAQEGGVGIGTSKPDNSAILDLSSNNKGLLMPRMTLSERGNIKNPATGLKIYQTDNGAGEYTFNGEKWVQILTSESKSIAAAGTPWDMGGNVATASDFIGTTNNASLKFRVNNQPAGQIDANSQNVALGYQAMISPTIGFSNLAFGGLSQGSATNSGNFNTSIGNSTLKKNTTGQNNLAIGTNSLSEVTSGSANTAIGANAMQLSTGSNNTAIGFQAGFINSGNGSVFIGSSAGTWESGSNKLYIANSDTDMPLLYGDFNAKYVTIGDVSPALRTQGTATGGYNLLVKGGILTEKVKVALATAGSDWADYVFEPEYKSKMMSLEEIEKFVNINKHLPNVPSANEMVKNGLDVSQTSKMFMEKIEELTLYIIELNKEIIKLKANK